MLTSNIKSFQITFSPLHSFIFLYSRSAQRENGPVTRGKDSDKKILKIENHNGGPLTQATREQGHPSLDRGLVTDQREDRKRERERDRGRDRGDINVFIPEGQMTMDEAIVQGEMLCSKAFL